jgi:murein DD-endopeptidase MepM/ murein hydrolase activator NlpD
VLAHLDPNSLVNKQRFNKGEVIGRVGTWPTNGNTFQHLHVQVVKKLDLTNFDGYGYIKDLPNNPNPFQFDFL